jgi:hypothetical protein
VGPIDQAELDRLAQQGIITPETLLWREGMPNWKSHRELAGVPASDVPPVALGGVRCIECGQFFSADQVIRLGPGFVCAGCKPVVMQKLGEGVMSTGAEQIRTDHIKHEASVKSVGLLYFLGGIVVILAGLGGLFSGGLMGVLVGGALMMLGGGQIATAVGLRKLKSWARIPTGIFSGIGLLGFPLGTLINAYILYLVFCRKGTTVFSDEYKRVIAETPHIKYRTSIVVWIFLGLLLLLFGAMFLVAIFGARSR